MKKLLIPLFCLSGAQAFGASFSDLGLGHTVSAISGNGNAVVGTVPGENGYGGANFAYRWQGGNTVVFASSGVGHSADAVSADGDIVAGYVQYPGGTYYQKYKSSTGTSQIYTFNDFDGWSAGTIAGISANGQRVAGSDSYYTFIPCQVGCSLYGDTKVFDGTYAFIEDANGKVKLGDLAGGEKFSQAQDISGDGNTVVGRSSSASGIEAFRWTQAGGMFGLGDLAGGAFGSVANATSNDGVSIVGTGTSGAGTEAFLWTAANGMIGLGDLAGGATNSAALSISGDGSTIVGYGTDADGKRAVGWDSIHGFRDLQTLATGLGMDLTGWNLFSANDVSDDGLVIAGEGKYLGANHGWVLDFRGLGYDSFSQIPSAVPLPATVWMFGTSLLGLAVARRSRA